MNDKVSTRQSDISKPGWLPWALVLLVTLTACFTHLYRLSDLWPVPYFDPAFNGLDALRVIRRGVRPLFFAANGGREPLFLYLQTLVIWLLGPNAFALRLPSALLGALTAPVLFGFGCALLACEKPTRRRWVAAWAALGLALSAWNVGQTREGLRVAMLPIVSSGTLWLFAVGWRRASLPHLAAAGALLGLSVYTYTAARFLPLVLVLAALPELLTKSDTQDIPRSQRWLGMGVLALAAAIVFAPLGWYYLRHPVMFAERAASVMIWNVWQPGSGSSLAEEMALSAWRTLFWFIRLPLPLALGLAAGVGVAAAKRRRFEYRLLPIWWLVMLLPAAFTIETPHLNRSLGAAPPTYLLIGVGLAAGAAWLARRWSISANLILVSGLALVALSSLPAMWDYFHPAKRDPRAGTQALLQALIAEARTGAVYLPLSIYVDPSLRFLLAADFEQRADWSVDPLPGPARLIQPAQGSLSPTLVRLSPDGWITLLPPLRSEGQTALQETATGGRPIVDRYGNIVAYEAALPASSDPARYLMQPDVHADARVVGLADLAGYRLDSLEASVPLPHLAPGGPLWVTTFWQAYGGAPEDYDLTVRLMDDAGHTWGRADGPPLEGTYPTSLWRSGEKIADGRLLWVDPHAPPGRYWLWLAFYDYLTDARLPVSGSSLPDTIQVGPLKLALPPLAEAPDGVQPQSARFGEVARLLGYRLTPQASGFALTLYWQAEQPDGVDYTVFVHLLDEDGQLVRGHDNQPVRGSYPTGIWEPGEVIPDEYGLDTSDLPPGEYRLEIGLYVLATGERLPTFRPDGTPDPARHVLLTTPFRVP
jgi:hypothetical protein